MEFVWNDGGRAASGFVGLTGDCVTRAIAIATGRAYREVYSELGKRSQKSPRKGISAHIAHAYLSERGWVSNSAMDTPLDPVSLPNGVVILLVSRQDGRAPHMFTAVDRVIHDTWNAADDDGYYIRECWYPTGESSSDTNSKGIILTPGTTNAKEETNQRAFDKIMRWLRALDKTASDSAATEAEKRNALRMMQQLMLSNNLSRDDIVEDDNAEHVCFTRMSCVVNGRRACGWEKDLATYVCDAIFPLVQWYLSPKGHRTIFIFYGPLSDVRNAISLFRELLLTIATAAHLRYGGHTRGSGASYAEGYVAGLPKLATQTSQVNDSEPTNGSTVEKQQWEIMQARTIAIHDASRKWLRQECNINLRMSSRRGRNETDPSAQRRGKQDGAKQQVDAPQQPKRITQQ